jgi:hypothetical protein
VFICPKCNIEVENPQFLPPPPWWRRTDNSAQRPYPVCPQGHRLRNRFLGNMTELALPLAFLRGLAVCGTALILGMMEDLRFPPGLRSKLVVTNLGLTMMTGVALILGATAFGYAWDWAGRSGPVHRLVSRACGIALGYLVPAIAASHALYFHWVHAAQMACAKGLLRVIGFIGVGKGI